MGDYQLVSVEWRLEPGGKRMAMRVPDEEVLTARCSPWIVVGWDAGSGIVRWGLSDDDVAEWTRVVAR